MPVQSEDLDYQRHMACGVLSCVFIGLIVYFVDNGGIVDRHCLRFFSLASF